MGLKTRIITVGVGEDIAAKIISFSQQGPQGGYICILTASGAFSKVTLRQGTVTLLPLEGRFDILTLSGSYLHCDSGVSGNPIGGLSVTFTHPDGFVAGGIVYGPLIAANEVKVTVLSFTHGGSKPKKMKKKSQKGR